MAEGRGGTVGKGDKDVRKLGRDQLGIGASWVSFRD
jgi:hypothetical protein